MNLNGRGLLRTGRQLGFTWLFLFHVILQEEIDLCRFVSLLSSVLRILKVFSRWQKLSGTGANLNMTLHTKKFQH